MKTLKCKKCGAEQAKITLATHESGRELMIDVIRLPFGLCQECFMKEFKDNEEMLKEKLPAEISKIALESLAEALAKEAMMEGDDYEVFDYQCPSCGKKAKGIGDKEAFENTMLVKPVCPECEEKQKERSARETAGEEQSFSM